MADTALLAGVVDATIRGLVALPGAVASRPVDLSTVLETPTLRGAIVFVLAVVAGTAVRYRYADVVDRSVRPSMDSPLVSVIYGFGAHLLIAFAAGVISTQLAAAGVDRTSLRLGSSAAVGLIGLIFAGLGFAVVGSWLTELQGERRPVRGVAVVAALLAIAALLLPPLAALLWVLVASVGMGGPTRRWIHAERSVESDA